MASIIKTLSTAAPLAEVWDAIRDVGAVHTRLVPGFVVATTLEDDGRHVTFVNGLTVVEPIVTIDDQHHRLVWTARGGTSTHYNGALHATVGRNGGTDVSWIADVLPDELAPTIAKNMAAGIEAMQRTLDQLAS
ncbi:MAG: SRPBCC family protein [Actinobacteria bacterium]|nr:SRPBCC family protein [Actinomycetota bacterium]